MSLKCDMSINCSLPIKYIDDKGYIYCIFHGVQRKFIRKCRKIKKTELTKLEVGKTIKY